MINKAEHCLLCENQSHNFNDSVYCGITEKKPDFNKTCDIVNFGKILEDKILEANVELELVKRTKVDTIGHLIIFTLIGMAVVYFGTTLMESFGIMLLTNDGGISAIALMPMVFIVLIGIGLMVFAIASLNLYRRNIKLAKSKKAKLDKILSFYKLTYTIDLKITKHWAGHKEVIHKLDIYPIKQKPVI